MKKKLVSTIIGSLLCLALIVPLIPLQPAQGAEVTLEVLNPKGNVEPIELQPLAERVDTLAGKKIELWFYGKDTAGSIPGCNVRDAIAYFLKEAYPTATIVAPYSKGGVAYNDTIVNYENPARFADVAVLGVAN